MIKQKKPILCLILLLIFCFAPLESHNLNFVRNSQILSPVRDLSLHGAIGASLPTGLAKTTLARYYRETCRRYNFSLPSSLKQHYRSLRSKYFYQYAQKKKQGRLRFYVACVLHDTAGLEWGECDRYQKRYGRDCNGQVKRQLQLMLSSIYRNCPGSSKVEKIYNYVNKNVRYRKETGSYPRFPIETLYYGHGDCEDQAMALAALLKTAGYQTAIYVLHDSRYDLHHCVCVVKVPSSIKGRKWRIKEYRSWGHCWLMLDPAYNHRFGERPSWLKNYLSKSGRATIPDKVGTCLLVDYNTYKAFCRKMDRR